MSLASELATVLSRTGPLELILAHARMADCQLGIYDSVGAPLIADGTMASLHPHDDGGIVRVDGGTGDEHGMALSVFDHLVGYVVASGTNGASEHTDGVATRAADFLVELCSREYELNDLSREILSAYEELNLFYDLASELSGAPDPGAICRVVLDKAVRALRAGRGWILLSSEDGPLRMVAGRNVDVDSSTLEVTGGIAASVMASRLGNLTDHPDRLDPAEVSSLEAATQVALITVPVYVPGGEDRSALGVLQLADRLPSRRRLPDRSTIACSPMEMFRGVSMPLPTRCV